jgi:lipoprotein-anchoring transpeptidase ErfK/SrfK
MTHGLASKRMPKKPALSRRNFIKLALLGLGGLAMNPLQSWFSNVEFPSSDRLGRACATLEIRARPDPESEVVGLLYEDYVTPWLREVAGIRPYYSFKNQRWVEIPEGYVYAPYFQPVKNIPNQPVEKLPQTSLGPGMWAEVTVPYADVSLVNEPSANSWVSSRLQQGQPLRIYYSQVFWVDRIEKDASGKVVYRINPNYYGGVDQLLVQAEAMRPINQAELTPIHPEAADKRIRVDVTRQALSCFEGETEVFYCRVSTGATFDMYGNLVDKWETPLGMHQVTRKFISLQMSGGTTGAPYDLPGIGWTVIFATGGVAIHSTFWHNNYGDTMSHGCVNVRPEDAKWIFRWAQPVVKSDPGMVDITISGEASTPVEVYQS